MFSHKVIFPVKGQKTTKKVFETTNQYLTKTLQENNVNEGWPNLKSKHVRAAEEVIGKGRPQTRRLMDNRRDN